MLATAITAIAATCLFSSLLALAPRKAGYSHFNHTNESGAIDIAWQGRALGIRDSGPGIEESIVERLDEPLVKGSTSTGFGLGLSSVKRLCDRFDAVLSTGPIEDGGTGAEVGLPA